MPILTFITYTFDKYPIKNEVTILHIIFRLQVWEILVAKETGFNLIYSKLNAAFTYPNNGRGKIWIPLAQVSKIRNILYNHNRTRDHVIQSWELIVLSQIRKEIRETVQSLLKTKFGFLCLVLLIIVIYIVSIFQDLITFNTFRYAPNKTENRWNINCSLGVNE